MLSRAPCSTAHLFIFCHHFFLRLCYSAPGTALALARTYLGNSKRNIVYGSGSRHYLDVYCPPRPPSSLSPIGMIPVLIFFHGGAWTHGQKWHYALFAERLASEGVVNYQSYNSANFEVYNCSLALDFVWSSGVDDRGCTKLLDLSDWGHECSRARRSSCGERFFGWDKYYLSDPPPPPSSDHSSIGRR